MGGLVLVLLAPTLGHGQEYGGPARVLVPGESIQARSRLRAIDRLLEPVVSPACAGSYVGRLVGALGPFDAPLALAGAVADRPPALWQRAEEAYFDLVRDAGEALAPMSARTDCLATAHTSLQLRRLHSHRLADMPAVTLAHYRRRVDGEAKQLLALSRKNWDIAPLRQLVDELFCSGSTPEALDLLGDLAFERGDFDEACAWWRLYAPLPRDGTADESLTLRWPGTARLDAARVQAKQILALAFAGSLVQAQDELARFHRRFPEARGRLAGRDGLYSETVHIAIQRVIRAGIANNVDPWTTFAGAPSRNLALSVCPSALLWEDGPTWRIALPAIDPPKKGKEKPGLAERHGFVRRAAFHPLIVNQQVLIADAESVTSYHLTTGKRLFRYDLRSAGIGGHGAERSPPMPPTAVPQYTLTAANGCVYARLGRQRLGPRRENEPIEPSYLVCLDLADPADALRPREKWHVASQGDEYFEGAPLVRAGRIYMALSRLAGKRVTTALQCYDALGRLHWSSNLCEVPEFEDNAAPRYRQHLVTWAGNQLVYCTHTGAVAAVDPWTGQTLWVVRYASRGPSTSDGEASPRDLAPCVYDDGRLFVAPFDSDRLYCLDAATGRLLWERDDLEIVQLLGSTQGRLVFTTRQGVQAMQAATGLPLWQQPSEGRLASHGRGMLAGSWLLWPTQDAKLPMRALTVAEGRQQKGDEDNPFAEPRFFDPTQLRHIPAGNFAFGNGCLVVAGLDELVAFVPAARQPLVPADPDQRLQIQAILRRTPALRNATD
jgi:outer membrane protein assembly factor BamB